MSFQVYVATLDSRIGWDYVAMHNELCSIVLRIATFF